MVINGKQKDYNVKSILITGAGGGMERATAKILKDSSTEFSLSCSPG